MKSSRTWTTKDYTYKMVENLPYGYRINKYDNKTGKLIDFVIGATEYSLAYWFENPDFRSWNKEF